MRVVDGGRGGDGVEMGVKAGIPIMILPFCGLAICCFT